MTVEYSSDGKVAYYDGYKFRKDPRTGYFLSTKRVPEFGRRIRLHVYVWTKERGPVPQGYQIHHIDENKDHNDIGNLALLSPSEHMRWHNTHLSTERQEQRRKNILEKGIPAAAEWHKSEAGHEWHLEHYEQTKDKLHQRVKGKCEVCGKEFIGTPHQRFCSNNCKSAYRRKSGVDDVKRICVVCGKEFNANRYSTKKTCSEACRREHSAQVRKERASLQYAGQQGA